jgi:hypothetical protein
VYSLCFEAPFDGHRFGYVGKHWDDSVRCKQYFLIVGAKMHVHSAVIDQFVGDRSSGSSIHCFGIAHKEVQHMYREFMRVDDTMIRLIEKGAWIVMKSNSTVIAKQGRSSRL